MNGERSKVLIIDDEKMNIISLAHFLKSQYEVIVAVDGTSGFEAAVKHRPDIILLDIIMPDISGFDVLVRLKDNDVTMKIPVIFITGLTDADDEEKGLTFGAVDYIAKPFNKSVVKARINTQLKMAEYVHTIERLCMIDTLTGLPNRRGFDSRMAAEWGRAFREKIPLGLLMLDIDKFKTYNDTYGHPQGDILLHTIAEVISSTVNRKTDFVCRWGGEEFVVLLPNTDLDGTVNIAEQIRNNILKTTIPCADGKNTSVTISLGAVSVIPKENDQAENLVIEADKLLYKAKENGRNQVCSS